MEKYSFEELKMMYESTEKVTDRRHLMNKTNYAINIAIIASIGVIWQWTNKNPNYFFNGMFLIIILSGIVLVFCTLWIRQIEDYKELNNAKFEVINEMSKNLIFDSQSSSIDIKSYIPFEKEWIKLIRNKAVQKNKFSRIVALKSSKAEFFIPKAFRIIFLLFFLVSFFVIIINPIETYEGIKLLLHLKKL